MINFISQVHHMKYANNNIVIILTNLICTSITLVFIVSYVIMHELLIVTRFFLNLVSLILPMVVLFDVHHIIL